MDNPREPETPKPEKPSPKNERNRPTTPVKKTTETVKKPTEPVKKQKGRKKVDPNQKSVTSYFGKEPNQNAMKSDTMPQEGINPPISNVPKREEEGVKIYEDPEVQIPNKILDNLVIELEKEQQHNNKIEDNISKKQKQLEDFNQQLGIEVNPEKTNVIKEAMKKITEERNALQSSLEISNKMIESLTEKQIQLEYQIKNLVQDKLNQEERFEQLAKEQEMLKQKYEVLEERPIITQATETPSYMKSTGMFIGAGILTSIVANVISHGIDDITDRFFKKEEPKVVIEEKKEPIQPVPPINITIPVSQEQRQSSRAIGKNYAKKIYYELKNERRN